MNQLQKEEYMYRAIELAKKGIHSCKPNPRVGCVIVKNDIVIGDPVFVPDHRTHKQMDGFACKNEQENPLYSLPWARMFIRLVSSPAMGARTPSHTLFG